MSNESFIDDNYNPPSSAGGYTKIQQGDNRLRILSKPLLVWVIWADGKPSRIPYDKDKKPSMPSGEGASVKHAWIMTVYNYATESIEIFELDKMTIINPLLNHVKDTDWGHPKHYDIVITKSGSGKDGTKYSMIAKPKKEVSEVVKEAYFETPIDLSEMLREGGNPFLSTGITAETPKKEEPKPEPKKAEPVKSESVKEHASNDAPPF